MCCDFPAGQEGLHAVGMVHGNQLTIEMGGIAGQTPGSHGKKDVLDASRLRQSNPVRGVKIGEVIKIFPPGDKAQRRLI